MTPPTPAIEPSLAGRRVFLSGKLSGMSRREAAELIRQRGGELVASFDERVGWVVMGDGQLPLADDGAAGPIAAAAARGQVELLGESQLFERLGLIEAQSAVHRLYTPAMLAELLKVPVAVIRRWHRRGLIVPARVVRRLPYFDFQEVASARRLAELLAAGATPAAIDRQLRALATAWPGVERPLAQLSVIVEGRDLLLRQGEGLVEPGGQRRFDFESWGQAARQAADVHDAATPSPETLLEAAGQFDDEGRLDEAVAAYRAALALGPPSAEASFRLAEALYRQGELQAARERYYVALELDEDLIEARFNLGCVLSELGEADLALEAFSGALAQHADYADAHFQLARLLDRRQRASEAEGHWRRFLQLAPESPWAEEARARVGEP